MLPLTLASQRDPQPSHEGQQSLPFPSHLVAQQPLRRTLDVHQQPLEAVASRGSGVGVLVRCGVGACAACPPRPAVKKISSSA